MQNYSITLYAYNRIIMDLTLYGKNALVCGASKGIGRACAIELSKLGAHVTLVSRSPDLMSEVIHEMDMDIIYW